jgi:hypothetical protein
VFLFASTQSFYIPKAGLRPCKSSTGLAWQFVNT